MRILFDECVPRPLRRELSGHDVCTIQEMDWAGKKNGELLALMAGWRSWSAIEKANTVSGSTINGVFAFVGIPAAHTRLRLSTIIEALP